MIGSFLTRGLVLVFGYAYPAYECYKTVEKNKPEIEQLRFWCQYWILVAFLTVCERIGDAFISWVPMYSEAKLAFFVYLWYPKTKGTTYVYDSFFRPYIAKHETEIDRNLLELRTRAGDMIVLYWQRAATYGQTRVFEILQYVAAQSTPRPHPQEQAGTGAHQPSTNIRQTSAPTRQPSTPRRRQAATEPEPEEPPSPTSSVSSSQQPMEVEEEVVPPKVPEAAPPSPLEASNAPEVNTTAGTSTQSAPTEAKTTHTEDVPSLTGKENADPQPRGTLIEETTRGIRAKLRKTKSAGNRQ